MEQLRLDDLSARQETPSYVRYFKKETLALDSTRTRGQNRGAESMFLDD